jgi:hypothetical protein
MMQHSEYEFIILLRHTKQITCMYHMRLIIVWVLLLYVYFIVTSTNLWVLDERKTNLMHLSYIFIVAVGDALHVSGVFAHRQER